MSDLASRVSRLEQWRSARWRDDDLYKKLPLIGERNLVEPTVVSVLKYFLEPGDVAFDVGSQAGHVVQAMSSLVGPRGLVVAFEASVRTARKLLINVSDANLRNVEIVHAAVCARGGQRLKLYLHKTQNNDSLFPAEFSEEGVFAESRFVYVDTLSIDQYCEKWGVYPRLIKLDIEGAEFEALTGAGHVLEAHRPVVLIEDFEVDLRSFDLLISRGYRCIDLITLKQLTRDERKASREANFLFVHESEPLPPLFSQQLTEEISIVGSDFISTNQTGLSVSPVIRLQQACRYVADWSYETSGAADQVTCIVGLLDFKNDMFARYQASIGLLKRHYCRLPFESDLDDQARFFVWTKDESAINILQAVSLKKFI